MAEGWVTYFAGDEPQTSWQDWAAATFGPGEILSVEDGALGMFRLALLREGRLEAVLLVAHQPFAPPIAVPCSLAADGLTAPIRDRSCACVSR